MADVLANRLAPKYLGSHAASTGGRKAPPIPDPIPRGGWKLVDATTDRARRNPGRCCYSSDPTIARRRRFRSRYQPASAFARHFTGTLRSRDRVTHTAKILYLAQTTRLFERPVSVAIKGISAGSRA